jgi:hypothetical protein
LYIFDDEGKRRFLEGVRVAPDSLLTRWIARIQNEPGNPEVRGLTNQVIHDFCHRQLFGLPQSPVTLKWLAEALERLRRHEPVDEVFPLPKRPRNRPASGALALHVAMWVHLARTRGYSLVEAKSRAAETFSKETKTIDRYVKAKAEWVTGTSQAAEWEGYFLAESKPLPVPQDKKYRS